MNGQSAVTSNAEEKGKGGTEVVVCLSCLQEVEVEMIAFGFGHIAFCPNCKHLAHNGD